MSLMVAANACGRTVDGVAVERHHVVAPRRPILKHEDLAPALGAKVEQLVSRAAQETGEIEVAGFERALCLVGLPHHRLSS
jgi:hypothetical protein